MLPAPSWYANSEAKAYLEPVNASIKTLLVGKNDTHSNMWYFKLYIFKH